GWRGTGFGAVFADFDQDGALDLAFVNGLVKRGQDTAPVAPGVQPFWAPYAQRNQLFANDGQGIFRDVSPANPAFCAQAAVGRGLACGDIDNDGAVDLLVTSTGGPAQLFRNVAPRRGHWLTVRAIDPSLGGRDAYGAEITVQAGNRRWWRLANPGFSYLCSNDPRVHFGLGSATTVDFIHVLWPDGREENFPGGPADRSTLLQKGRGPGEAKARDATQTPGAASTAVNSQGP
ncbi:MAG TPA: CRTAC1 family protein, partial [Candidatus Binatia bacterium]|nr:CRTAC1 family protein [Candidatus Binatia bacterium]